MSHYAKTGGILTIISGAFAIFYMAMCAIYIFFIQFAATQMRNQQFSQVKGNFPPEVVMIFTIIFALVGLFYALAGALAITGGIFALKTKRWAVALAGAIAGALLFFPCGIAGTILISMGRCQFQERISAPDPVESIQFAATEGGGPV
jgi:hypothetical protein